MPVDASASDHLRGVFEANGADILAYLERRVVPRADAADVLSEAMVVAWRRINRLPAGAEPARMWLFVIARNCLLNHNRGRRRTDATLSRFRSEFSSQLPVDPADQIAVALDVQRALASLPGDLAELVRLVHWDRFPLVDAAALLGIPPATARGRYLRARGLLHELLIETTSEVTN
jgi:RNA polymerase sigma-70 factor (ECF subfamily)